MRRTCEATVDTSAPAPAVWEVVADVTRVGEWSSECQGCAWVGGADAAVVGARFRGRNRRGGFRWTRLNEVVEADVPRTLVWRTLARFPYPDSTEWRVSLVETEEGARVTESFRVLRMPKVMEWMIGIALPAHRDRAPDLAEDLNRLKALVESPQ